ncbi:MAG: S41 family peptidase [Saprospiraceae bacterium]|nr:S41 family peptidase [Saprospiraceae bacterium]
MKNSFLILSLTAILLISCQKSLFEEFQNTDPARIFTEIWKDFDENYGLFEVKKMDWDSVYQSHFPLINSATTDDQLYSEVTAMLATLNDKHVTLFPASSPDLPRWSVDLDDNGIYHNDVFDLQVIKDHYLTDLHQPSPFIHYGKLDPNTGYIHLQHLDGHWKDYEKAIDAALASFSKADGLIIDLRDCSGGYDPVAQYVAGRFCKESYLFMTTKKKNGPAHNDFSDPQLYYIKPTGKTQFTGSIIVMTSSITASAGETLTLALKTQSHIKQSGGITSGNYSDNPMWEASNGWSYTISIGDYRDANGTSLESIGIIPDVEIASDKSSLQTGRDLVLEKSLEILKY